MTRVRVASLSPDFNNDGVVEPDEQILFDALVAADTDGDGSVSRREFYAAMLKAAVDVEEAKKIAGVIPIKQLVPTKDSPAWYTEIFDKVKLADLDRNENISATELFEVLRRAFQEVRDLTSPWRDHAHALRMTGAHARPRRARTAVPLVSRRVLTSHLPALAAKPAIRCTHMLWRSAGRLAAGATLTNTARLTTRYRMATRVSTAPIGVAVPSP